MEIITQAWANFLEGLGKDRSTCILFMSTRGGAGSTRAEKAEICWRISAKSTPSCGRERLRRSRRRSRVRRGRRSTSSRTRPWRRWAAGCQSEAGADEAAAGAAAGRGGEGGRGRGGSGGGADNSGNNNDTSGNTRGRGRGGGATLGEFYGLCWGCKERGHRQKECPHAAPQGNV